ncbi:hypothetical protein J3R83DRAFT_7100, partial [Lanmaoa asiatica]
LILSHIHSQLSAQLTQALICLSSKSLLNLVKAKDLKAAAQLPDLNEEQGSKNGWDSI